MTSNSINADLSHSHPTVKVTRSNKPSSIEHSSQKQVKAQSQTLESNDVIDALTIEEPMEIVIEQELLTGLETTSVYVTMRTPGQDIQLTKGFLFSEGFIQNESDIVSIKHCGPEMPPYQLQNIVKVTLKPSINWKNKRAERQTQGNSSCGLCGVTSLQAVKMGISTIQSSLRVEKETLLRLETELENHQPMFTKTGGIHAVSLFDERSNWVTTMEDIGRHNAMDKLIGYALEQQCLPLSNYFIITTSRASFELVQKSSRAGCAMLVAVSAPSSLAVQLAEDVNQTLVGFLRANRFNVYTDKSGRLN